MLRLPLALVLALPAAAETFLDWYRKGERMPAPEEKLEYFNRALTAWRGEDGNALLSACHHSRGKAFLDLDRPEEAAADFGKAIALDHLSAPSYLQRARAYARLGKLRSALRDLDEYVASRPEDAEGRAARGEMNLDARRPAAAQKDFRKLANLAADDPRGPLGLGRSLAGLGRCRDALAEYEKALALAQERPAPRALPLPPAEVHLWRGVCRGELGSWEPAFEDLGEAVRGLEDLAADRRRSVGSGYPARAAELRLARAHFERGALHRRRSAPKPALKDFDRACGLGYPPGCAAADELRGLAARPAPPKEGEPPARPKAKPKPKAPAKKKRKSSSPKGPGERIYAY